MHPVLVELPLPSWNVPLSPALLVLALALGALAAVGWRKRLTDLRVVGVVGALACAVVAIALRGVSHRLQPIAVHTYGVMLCASLVAGWYLTLALATRAGQPKVEVANCYFWTALGGLVGARLLYVLTSIGEFAEPLSVFDFRGGGLVAYGGFLGGLAASAWYARRRTLSWLGFCDAAVPSVALGLALTRIGCYAFGCDFGKPLAAGAPGWLKTLGTFPRWPEGTLAGADGSPAWLHHVLRRGLSFDSTSSLAVHPTQLYESLVGLSLMALLLWSWPRKHFNGQLLLSFGFAYGVLRFLLELIRDDPERGAFGPHLPLQWLVALGLLAFGIAYGLGPARSSQRLAARAVGVGLWPLSALAVFLLIRSMSAASAQLSTSQWIALTSAVAAGGAWTMAERLTVASARADSAPSPHP